MKKYPLVNCCGKQIVEGDMLRYARLKLKPLQFRTLVVDDLHFTFTVDYENVLKPFFNEGREVKKTPHFKLLKYYETYGWRGLKKDFRKLGYYKYFMCFNLVGYKTNYFNPKEKIPVVYEESDIWKKIKNFIGVYQNIKKYGYHDGPYPGRYISVLEVPFVVSRFGRKMNYEPYEIFTGHHRASCLAALGHTEIEVLELKDEIKNS